MGDTSGYLKPLWEELTRHVEVDKIYLETHRDLIIVDQATLTIAKKFFRARGIEVAGGITLTVSEPNRFQTFCYSSPEDRQKVRALSEYTARNFDEFILDDFFFTNCKDDGAIKEKGNRSWTQYRLELMAEAAKSLIIGPAKAVNPRVKVVVKYPNWYEHFQGLGFNLEKEPHLFDGIYTGTETRDAVTSAQHLQPYLGYNIFRYFENIAPGRNGGAWVDPFAMGTPERYSEQLWTGLFAKAPEQTLFDLRSVSPKVAAIAGYSFAKIDSVLGWLGKPIGIKSYRPFHSTGEDFLQNFLGMAGLPMDMRPAFPFEDSVVLLTEEARFDPGIVDKIKKQLTSGKTVVITSGLLRALQDKGLNDIAELRYTDRKAFVQDYTVSGIFRVIHTEKPVLLPQINYLTNDSWEIASGIAGPNGWPILHEADYSKGHLYVLTIPENFADLYHLPAEVLNKVREVLGRSLPVQLEGPGRVSIYVYDNNTCVVESFLDSDTTVSLVTAGRFGTVRDLVSGESYAGVVRKPGMSYIERARPERNVFSLAIKSHSFRVFRLDSVKNEGAFVTGRYRNLFAENGHSEKEIDEKIEKGFGQLFHGDTATQAVYFEAGSNADGPMAYVSDVPHHDIRSEGMSYGMMICVQLDRRKEFDAIWNYAMHKMYIHDTAHPSHGYFSWSLKRNGEPNEETPAPDGEEYFVTALYFAANRWGNGTGIYNYRGWADTILTAMRHHPVQSGNTKFGPRKIGSMVYEPSKMIRFVPGVEHGGFTDASYHLPHFYELWARWGPVADRAFWSAAADTSRSFFVRATNPVTGLCSDYANFDGSPHTIQWNPHAGDFSFDSWRTASNWSVDWSWFHKGQQEQALSDRIQGFFASKGITSYGDQYTTDGKLIEARHAAGLTATNAVASLAATRPVAKEFVEELWKQPVPHELVERYYDGLLYLMSMLHCSGRFRIWQ